MVCLADSTHPTTTTFTEETRPGRFDDATHRLEQRNLSEISWIHGC